MELALYPVTESKPKLTPQAREESSQQPHIYPPNPQATLEQALNTIFPQKNEEDKVARMRTILGETAKELSDPQIEIIITEFQFLIDSWLDEYEKEVFGGLTLKEVLNEG